MFRVPENNFNVVLDQKVKNAIFASRISSWAFPHETFFLFVPGKKKSLVWKCPRRDTTGKNCIFNFLIEDDVEMIFWDPGHFKGGPEH